MSRPEDLLKRLTERGETVGFVESCTGGLLSSSFVALAGVSDVFKGAGVSYSYEAKSQIIGVRPDTLTSFGAVSEEVAREMVQGGKVSLNVDWCVSITGIAGPGGGMPDKPVGTVWFAVLGPNVEESCVAQFSGSRNEIQSQSVDKAYDLLLGAMTK